MATGNTGSTAGLKSQGWAKDLHADAIDQLYFNQIGVMGKGDNYIVSIDDELSKVKGEKKTFGISYKLNSGKGTTGDSELEGNEKVLQDYSQDVAIDQIREAVRLKGSLEEQKTAYDMRMNAKSQLATWKAEMIERQIFFKLGGVNNTSLTDVNGVAVAELCAWSNAPAQVPAADTAAGTGDRYLCADSSGADSLASTDIITPQLISRAKKKAMLASPRIQPLKVNGKNYFVMFVHPNQAYDLYYNATFAQARREAEVRGKENPIFTGALGVWDGVVIHEHEYVPYLDISVAGHNFNSATVGTDFSADCYRALLCGRQAVCYADCKNPKGWVEETFDYSNKVGFATGLIGGIQKTAFNSLDYAVIAVDTASSL